MCLILSFNFTIKKENFSLISKLLKLSLSIIIYFKDIINKLNGTLKSSVNILEKETFVENGNDGEKLCLLIIYMPIKN